MPVNLISTQSYSYTDDWGDLLTAYNGVALTYDEIGNPLTYYNGASYTFEWLGRRLMSASKGTDSLSFTYNTDGIRTSKTKNGVTTEYFLNGSDIVAEKTNGNMTLYVYGADGSVIGMMYHGASYSENQWDVFWFEKNMQGDIVAVYNESGTKLVSYTYDAWGSFSRTYHNDGQNTAAANNPFTYRGYYYDYDLKFYYLNSRYYDPYVGRFINSDSLIAGNSGSIHGHNLFVYCFNNPISLTDSEGGWPEWVETSLKAIGDAASQAYDNVANTVKKVANKIKETDLVYSTGLNLNGQLGSLTVNVKAGLAIDRDGDITIYSGADSGLAAPSYSLSLTNYHSLYLAPESTDILGEGAQIGASGNLPGTPFVAGGEFNVLGNPNDGNSYYGGTVYSGIGTPGFTPYYTQGYNHEIKTFNILDIFKRS